MDGVNTNSVRVKPSKQNKLLPFFIEMLQYDWLWDYRSKMADEVGGTFVIIMRWKWLLIGK
jgi:hypothetical protein